MAGKALLAELFWLRIVVDCPYLPGLFTEPRKSLELEKHPRVSTSRITFTF